MICLYIYMYNFDLKMQFGVNRGLFKEWRGHYIFFSQTNSGWFRVQNIMPLRGRAGAP